MSGDYASMTDLKCIDAVYACGHKLGLTEIDEIPQECPQCGGSLEETVER